MGKRRSQDAHVFVFGRYHPDGDRRHCERRRHGSAALPGHLRRDFRRCRIGQAVATPGCGLPCRYIIHVAGPGWYGGEPRERFLLAGCYQNALHKAYLCSCRRVAVPLIFSGDCHMPRAASLRVAGAAIADFCQRHPSMEVTLVLYRQSIYDMAKRILGWEDAPS